MATNRITTGRLANQPNRIRRSRLFNTRKIATFCTTFPPTTEHCRSTDRSSQAERQPDACSCCPLFPPVSRAQINCESVKIVQFHASSFFPFIGGRNESAISIGKTTPVNVTKTNLRAAVVFFFSHASLFTFMAIVSAGMASNLTQ